MSLRLRIHEKSDEWRDLRREEMFNILAEALLIAVQMGQASPRADRRHRRMFHGRKDIEVLPVAKRSTQRDRPA